MEWVKQQIRHGKNIYLDWKIQLKKNPEYIRKKIIKIKLRYMYKRMKRYNLSIIGVTEDVTRKRKKKYLKI